ncbi:MAG TPA: hypothetical protein VMA09_12790 [Candidatus Binataceae bacterium]|nr:hypothetical protein [Candidatus Binataceae bacterium]
MSTPTSATITLATVALTPAMVTSRSMTARKGLKRSLDLRLELANRLTGAQPCPNAA